MKQETGNNRRKSLAVKLLLMAGIPLLVFGLIVTWFSSYRFRSSMNAEVANELKSMGITVENIYDMMYPGDYKCIGTDEIAIFKGETLLNDNFRIIDSIKEDADIDVMVYYKDLTVLSTVTRSDGTRSVGTSAHAKITKEVYENHAEKFYDNVTIDGIKYYAYYLPIYNSDGSCFGMVAVAKPSSQVNGYVGRAVAPIFLIAILALAGTALVSTLFARRLVSVIIKIKASLSGIAEGDLSKSVDAEVLQREDELGEIGHSIIVMQKALREYLELDKLTGLYNRRFSDSKLDAVHDKAERTGLQYYIAIGDIDFFKKFNDEYGHQCGDLILQRVATVLKRGMAGRGFVSRWGGEEFLLVFDRGNYDNAVRFVNEILEEIRTSQVPYNGELLSVTMTFGITKALAGEETRIVLKRADALLYEGKSSGRNKVVSEEPDTIN